LVGLIQARARGLSRFFQFPGGFISKDVYVNPRSLQSVNSENTSMKTLFLPRKFAKIAKTAAHSLIFVFLCGNSICKTQVQQAWVARYNNGILNGTNEAVKLALDTNGNIYVTGFSQNTNGNLDYATIKYAPNGSQVWVTRFDSTNTSAAIPAAIVVDASNNVVITGNAVTVNYGTNGNQLWTAPYAGTALAVDANCNVYVVGFDTNFGTAKLSAAGSNLWQTTYPSSFGANTSQAVAVDDNGNVDVAGNETWSSGPDYAYRDLLLMQYDKSGNPIWVDHNKSTGDYPVEVRGVVLDNVANLYLVETAPFSTYVILKIAANGTQAWAAFDPASGFTAMSSFASGLAIDSFHSHPIEAKKTTCGP